MANRLEKDSLGEVSVPSDKLWGAQTQRSLEHFMEGAREVKCSEFGDLVIKNM